VTNGNYIGDEAPQRHLAQAPMLARRLSAVPCMSEAAEPDAKRRRKVSSGRVADVRAKIVTRLSMPEMPRAGEHHGDAMVVGGLDHLIIAH
jgi:hypothetical protein